MRTRVAQWEASTPEREHVAQVQSGFTRLLISAHVGERRLVVEVAALQILSGVERLYYETLRKI